jgi:hypothetical protein
METESTLDSHITEPSVNRQQFWNTGMSQKDWLDELCTEQLKKGAFDNLPGKGKSLEIQSGDVFNSILKHANVLPDWLLLQHEIKEEFRKLLSTLPDSDENKIERKIAEINKKIKKYNTLVPSSTQQKRMIVRDNMEGQYQHWV